MGGGDGPGVEAKDKESEGDGLGAAKLGFGVSATRAPIDRRGDWWRCAGEARAGDRRAGFGEAARTEADLRTGPEAGRAAVDREDDGDTARVVLVDIDLLSVALGISASTAAPAAACADSKESKNV